MSFQLLRAVQTASRRAAFTPISKSYYHPIKSIHLNQAKPSQPTNPHPHQVPSRLASNNSAESTTSPENATGAQPSAASDSTSAGINSSRATESRTGSPDTASVQTPVSNPSEAGAALSEEPQLSQENMRRDPSEPDHVKREHVEREGMKKMDAGDEPVTGGSK
jgi:hypothetical protein